MRMSCNGCRVLRKGCGEDCVIKPCLQWIKSSDAQANATVFLAKFYGRAGLINLISAGPQHLRPVIFRSLLYEACGRIVNPIYGSAGLLWSGNWQLCHAAVDAVLNGAPIVQVSSESAASAMSPPLNKACDIRHVSKQESSNGPARDLRRVKKGRGVFKRGGGKPKPKPKEVSDVDDAARVMWSWSRNKFEREGSVSHDSGASQGSEPPESGAGDSFSVETVEESLVKSSGVAADGSDVDLELTLGFEPVGSMIRKNVGMEGWDHGTCKVDMI